MDERIIDSNDFEVRHTCASKNDTEVKRLGFFTILPSCLTEAPPVISFFSEPYGLLLRITKRCLASVIDRDRITTRSHVRDARSIDRSGRDEYENDRLDILFGPREGHGPCVTIGNCIYPWSVLDCDWIGAERFPRPLGRVQERPSLS